MELTVIILLLPPTPHSPFLFLCLFAYFILDITCAAIISETVLGPAWKLQNYRLLWSCCVFPSNVLSYCSDRENNYLFQFKELQNQIFLLIILCVKMRSKTRSSRIICVFILSELCRAFCLFVYLLILVLYNPELFLNINWYKSVLQ